MATSTRRKLKANDFIEWIITIPIALGLIMLFNVLTTVISGAVLYGAVVMLIAMGFLVYFFVYKGEEPKSLLVLFALMFPVAGLAQFLGPFLPLLQISTELTWFSFATLLSSVFLADIIAEAVIDLTIA